VNLSIWTDSPKVQVDFEDLDITKHDRLSVVKPLLSLLAPLHGDRHV